MHTRLLSRVEIAVEVLSQVVDCSLLPFRPRYLPPLALVIEVVHFSPILSSLELHFNLVGVIRKILGLWLGGSQK